MDMKLCPHCMTPLSLDPMSDTWECPRCGQDTSTRGPVNMDEDQYYDRERKQCLYCGQEILQGATVCPSCRAILPE